MKTQVAIDPMDLFMPFMGQDEVWFLMRIWIFCSFWCSIFLSIFSAITEIISHNNVIFVNYRSGLWIILFLFFYISALKSSRFLLNLKKNLIFRIYGKVDDVPLNFDLFQKRKSLKKKDTFLIKSKKLVFLLIKGRFMYNFEN